MNYPLYVFLIWITYPVRWLMFFYSNDRFYAHLLFGFRYKFYWAWCQVELETADMTSNLIENYNNVCGMGYIGGKYQDGSLKGPDGGRTVATYKRRYRGWYDYYDLLTNRYKGVNQVYFSKEPGGDPPRFLSYVTNQEAIDYMFGMCLVLKGVRFYGGSVDGYWTLIRAKMTAYAGSQKWMYYLMWFLWFIFLGAVIWLARCFYRAVRGSKGKSPQDQYKTPRKRSGRVNRFKARY